MPTSDHRYVELNIIAPKPGITRLRRASIDRCKLVAVSTPPRVVVRLFDGSVLVVTKESVDAAGLPIQ